MHNILIGITKELSHGQVTILDGTDYYKKVVQDSVYFQFDVNNWNHPDNQNPPEILYYLDQAGESNYALVVTGEDPDNVAISGTVENFDIHVDEEEEMYE